MNVGAAATQEPFQVSEARASACLVGGVGGCLGRGCCDVVGEPAGDGGGVEVLCCSVCQYRSCESDCEHERCRSAGALTAAMLARVAVVPAVPLSAPSAISACSPALRALS